MSPPASARPADNQVDHHGWREGVSEYWEWVAIKKQFATLEGENKTAAEFFMSISGTIIRYKEGQRSSLDEF